MGRHDIGVGGIKHGGLDVGFEDHLGVTHNVRVEGILARNKHCKRLARLSSVGPARAPELLPQGRARPRPPRHEHGIETGDVDAKLEGVGRGEAEKLSRTKRCLECAALLGKIAAAIGGDARGPIGKHGGSGRFRGSVDGALCPLRDELARTPRASKDERLRPLAYEVTE